MRADFWEDDIHVICWNMVRGCVHERCTGWDDLHTYVVRELEMSAGERGCAGRPRDSLRTLREVVWGRVEGCCVLVGSQLHC